jgi:RNA ligase
MRGNESEVNDRPQLYDIVDRDELRAAIEAKHVREQFHPSEPLAILNYTEACVYENGWNDTTLLCRGLIYNTDDGQVVARPFAKFFNYGQPGAAEIPLDADVSVTDKVDGSLGIIYRRPSDGFYAVATRGSFGSDQALHATELLGDRYPDFEPDTDTTYLVEIVYPENRIVLDYGDQDDLILLGAVDIATGVVDEPAVARVRSGWAGPITETFTYRSLAEALAAAPRPNAEGFVVRRTTGRLGAGLGDSVKIKQEDYVALHKIVTGLSQRTVWQHLVDGLPIEDLIKPLPDEFHTWVREVAHELNRAVDRRATELHTAYFDLVSADPTGFSVGATDDAREVKKRFALEAKGHPDAWALFALYDGKDIRPKLWDQVKPEAFLTPSGRTFSEDAA